MHFSVLIFHEWDAESVVSKYNYECEDEDDGVDMQFSREEKVSYYKKEYKKLIKESPEEKEKYPEFEW